MTSFEPRSTHFVPDDGSETIAGAAGKTATISIDRPASPRTDSGAAPGLPAIDRPANAAPDRRMHRLAPGRPGKSGSIRDDRTLSHFIGNIYDAALDPELWPQVLAAAAGYVGGQAAGLLSKNSASAVCTVHDQFGFESGYVSLYRNEYWKIDPFAVAPFFPVEQPTTIEDFVALDEFQEGRFYREWLQPQGWIDAASVVIERSPAVCSTFVVARHESRGMVDDEMRSRLSLIAPHIRAAARIGRMIDSERAERTALADVLDGLSAGLFLVDGGARIVHANIAGRAILATKDILESVQGRLIARDPAIDRTLRAALAAATPRNLAHGDGPVSMPLVSPDGEVYVAHLLPLTSEAGPGAGIAKAAVAALFVHRATLANAIRPESVARHYQLTPTELRVLLGIVEVGGAPEVADALGIADNTVKTHLGRLYQKTGTRRQVDLVRLVAGFSTPLLDQPHAS